MDWDLTMQGFLEIFKRAKIDSLHSADGTNGKLHDLILGEEENEAGRKESWQMAKDAGVTGDALALLE